MDTPDTIEGQLTEQLMAAIRPHLRVDPPPQEHHHYNRAYEAVYRVLRTWHTWPISRRGGDDRAA